VCLCVYVCVFLFVSASGSVYACYVKPARSINFITLNFIATRTGVAFSEVGG